MQLTFDPYIDLIVSDSISSLFKFYLSG